MKDIVEIIEESVNHSPLSLLDLSENAQKLADTYLPYSIGIEIECEKRDNFNVNDFMLINNILDVRCSDEEQRFRIPSGLKGLICLFEVCEKLKENSLLNMGSGIHYHIDMTEYFNINYITYDNFKLFEETILTELDAWKYEGTYNSRRLTFDGGACWARFRNSYKTLEIRIGEMTFDYNTILNRIKSGCFIVDLITKGSSELILKSKKLQLEKLQKTIIEEEKKEISIEDIREQIKNRIVNGSYT